MSLAKAIIKQLGATPEHTLHILAVRTQLIGSNSTQIATKYPIGVFQSNGILEQK